MTQNKTVLPEGWKRPPGFSHAMLSPGVNLVMAGQFGWDPASRQCVEGGFVPQWEQALQNVRTLVEEVGGEVTDIVGLRVLVLSMSEYRGAGSGAGEAWGRVFGRHFPAITLFEVGGLTDPDARLEVEAYASVPDSKDSK